jgi:predicted ATPase/transcriptional regulator with XRE-family HTH domain/Tfp pilus assembly protein PilF
LPFLAKNSPNCQQSCILIFKQATLWEERTMSLKHAVSPEQFTSFGELFIYLRRRTGLTQRELAIALGYSDSQISRLEHNQRVPDRATLSALFLPAFDIEHEPEWAARLFELADEARRPIEKNSGLDMHPDPSHNLPLQLNSYLGREQEMAEIVGLLSAPDSGIDQVFKPRLVTLTGPGGVGKTRLAIQAAFDLLGGFPDGVWMVDLAPLGNPALVAQTVAAALGLRDGGGQPILANLIAYLRRKAILLLLDNCEHLVEACAHLAEAILRSCPNVSILATSREPLGIAGEVIFPVEPLQTPEPGLSMPVEALAQYDAVRLFVERSQAVRPGFQLTTANSAAVSEVCRQLDGLPLAIELSAAHMNVLSAAQIAARLADMYRLLGRGSRTSLARAQTLRACMDWSYNLLTETERLLLARLAVFVGGWTLEAAESVCTDERLKPPEVFPLLAQLVAKSLVVVDRHQPARLRYRFLETIYQYALEKLNVSGETPALRGKHLSYFFQMLDLLDLELAGAERLDRLNRLEADHDNLRSALEWSLTNHIDSALSLRLATKLGVFWDFRGFLGEGRERLSAVLAKPGAEALSQERADLLYELAWLAIYQGDILAGMPLLEECHKIYKQLQPAEKRGEARVLSSLAAIEIDNGEAGIALEHAQKALETASEASDPYSICFAHHMLGLALGHLGEYDRAWDHLEISLAIGQKIGRSSIPILQNLGEVAVRQGNDEKGKQYVEQALGLATQAKDRWNIASALGTLGWIALRQAEFERTRDFLGRSLAVRQEIGDEGGSAWCLEKMAELATLQGNPEKAASLLGAAAALRQAVNSQVNSADRPDYDQLVLALQAQIEPRTFQAAWEAGSTLSLQAAIQLALEAPAPPGG